MAEYYLPAHGFTIIPLTVQLSKIFNNNSPSTRFSLHTSFQNAILPVKKLVERHKMLAECVIAVGTMLIPLAVVLLTTVDNFPQDIAIFLILLGVISLITGLAIAIRSEIRASKKERRLDRRDNLRRRIDKASLIVTLHVAEKLGVDMGTIEKAFRSQLDKSLEQELKDLEDEDNL